MRGAYRFSSLPPGEYRIPGRYLQRALAVRGDLDALLAQQLAGLRKARGR